MSHYHLIHEADICASKMVASEDEKSSLRDLSLMGIFPYLVEKYSGSPCRRIESLFQSEILRLRMGQRWTR